MSFAEVLAFAALALFGVHTALMCAAVLTALSALRRQCLPAARVRHGTAGAGAGPGGALAEHRVEQVGRLGHDGDVYFHDRTYASTVFGGELVDAQGQTHALDPSGHVWIDATRLTKRASTPPQAEALEDALTQARRARGHSRTLLSRIEPGAKVWWVAEGHGPGFVSDHDPVARVRTMTRWALGLVIGIAALATACVVTCLWPPRWGTVSLVGALVAVVLFQLFRLWSKLAIDALRSPERALVGGRWRKVGARRSTARPTTEPHSP